jgi:DNA processing protein
MTEREAYILLNMMEGIGPVRVRHMLEALGSAVEAVTAHPDAMQRARGVGEELARSIANQREQLDVAEECRKAKAMGAEIITPLDDEYPAALKEIHDPPLALYVLGTLEKKDRHAIAIVGSRRSTLYGKQVADRLGYQLAQTGFTVLSGLARGIDTAAHEGCLKGEGRTIAVMGGALDKVYPPENETLARQIVKHGAVISEFAMGREPDRTTFAIRNRIVSGMSMGVVVVEAGSKSGALITADVAAEQGRTIFAVPGRIDSQASRGTHKLIKAGARLVEDVDDILQEFEFLIPPEQAQAELALTMRPEVRLDADEQAVVKALWQGPMDMDGLAREAGLSSARISAMLIGLEMKRVVRMLPGRQVELSVEWNMDEAQGQEEVEL